MVSKGTGGVDPFKADAAVVYREMRDHGPGTLVELSDRCFPSTFGEADPAYKALRKRAYRRVLDSVIWMRHQKVTLSVIPGDEGSIFHLGFVAASVSPLRALTLFDDGVVQTLSPTERGSSKLSVTGKVSQGDEITESDAMDVWHGRK